MTAKLMLLSEFLPMDALGLGWLVESIKDPIVDAYAPKKTLPKDAILCLPAKSFRTLLSYEKSTSFRFALTRLLGNSYAVSDGSDSSLQSVRVNRYQLKQPRQVFKTLCLEEEKAQQWLNEGIRAGTKSYLVVELQTAEDATVSRSKHMEYQTDVDVTVPVSTIATGGMDVLGVGAMLDSGGGVGFSRRKENQKEFVLEGENIFAVGYKKIIWKTLPFQRKEIDHAVLDKEITWSIFGQKRGREEEEELISVDLTDELVEKDAGEEREKDDEDEGLADDVADLIKNSVEVDGQTYLLALGKDSISSG